MARPTGAIFALKAWTIKESGGKYYISPTGCFDDRVRWSKPYQTLQRACTAIARKLAAEWQERDERRRHFHGSKEAVR
jgi:hypothetical protein